MILQREGIKRRVLGPWTTAAIKDLYRRREMYRGNVTARRGVEVLPGRHPAILSHEEYADAVSGSSRARGTRRQADLRPPHLRPARG